MANQNPNQGWAKASLWCGALALVNSLLPLASIWFIMLSWLTWVLIGLSVLFAIIALVNKQSVVRVVIAVALCLCAYFVPGLLIEQAASTAASAISTGFGML